MSRRRSRPLGAPLLVSCLLALGVAGSTRSSGQPPASMLDPDAEYRLIAGMLDDGLHALALDRIDEFLERYPDDPRSERLAFRRAELLARGGSADAAREAYAAYLERHPDGEHAVDARIGLAEAELSIGRLDDAQARLEQLLAEPEPMSDAQRRRAETALGRLHFAAQRYTEAILRLKDVWRSAGDPELLRMIGDSYFALRRFKDARAIYEETLARDGLGAAALYEARYRLGLIAYHLGRHEEAETRFTELLHERPRDMEVASALAWTLYGRSEYARSFDVIANARGDRDELEAGSSLRAAEELALRGDYAAAAEALARIGERHRDTEVWPRAQLQLVRAQLALDRTEEALRSLDVYLGASARSSRGTAETLFELGEELLLEGGRLRAARGVYRRVISLTSGGPLSDRARLRVARVLAEEGDRETALEQLREFVRVERTSRYLADAYLMLADIAYDSGLYAEAAATYRSVEGGFPDSPLRAAALRGAGRAHAALGEWERSADALRAFLDTGAEGEQRAVASLELATALRRVTRDEDAAAVLSDAAAMAELPVELAHRIGGAYAEVLLQLERWEEAEGALRPLAAGGEAPARVGRYRYLLGIALAAQGRDEEARPEFAAVAQLAAPAMLAAQGAWQLAQLQSRTGDTAAAVATLTRLTQRLPEQYWADLAQQRLERLLLAQGEIQRAVESMPEFVLGDPDAMVHAAEALDEAAELFAKGQRGKAMQTLKRLTRDFPGSPEAAEAHYQLGVQAENRRLESAAREQFEAVVEAPAADSRLRALAHYKLGHLALRDEDYATASRHYEQAWDGELTDELRPPLAYLLGRCAEAQGERRSALEHYARFAGFALAPDAFVEERIKVGLVFQQAGELGLARDVFSTLLAGEPSADLRAELQYYLAETYELDGDLEQALIEYLKVTYLTGASDPMWSTTARFKAGNIYETQGRWDEAIKLYRGIAEANPDTRQGEFAAERIQEIEQRRPGGAGGAS